MLNCAGRTTLKEPISDNLFQFFPLRVNLFQPDATVSTILSSLPSSSSLSLSRFHEILCFPVDASLWYQRMPTHYNEQQMITIDHSDQVDPVAHNRSPSVQIFCCCFCWLNSLFIRSLVSYFHVTPLICFSILLTRKKRTQLLATCCLQVGRDRRKSEISCYLPSDECNLSNVEILIHSFVMCNTSIYSSNKGFSFFLSFNT